MKTLSNRLENPSFTQKAPEKVVLECRDKLSDAQSQAELVRNYPLNPLILKRFLSHLLLKKYYNQFHLVRLMEQ